MIMQELQATVHRINQLQENVDKAKETINKRKIEIDEQLLKTNQARNTAQEARFNANTAMSQGTEALKMLRIIQQAIEQLPNDIDRIEELSALEQDLSFIEQTLAEAKIGDRINALKLKNEEVGGSLNSFTESASTLAEK